MPAFSFPDSVPLSVYAEVGVGGEKAFVEFGVRRFPTAEPRESRITQSGSHAPTESGPDERDHL